MNSEITDAAWKALYDQANILKKAKPWQWMDAEEIIAIEDEISKINYYYMMSDDSVQMLTGEKGISRFLYGVEMMNLQEEGWGDTPEEVQEKWEEEQTLLCNVVSFDEESYSCFFCDRGELDEDEYQRIKHLGYSFRGANQWMSFVVSKPGQVVRDFETPEEVALFTRVLTQLNTIVLAKKEKKPLPTFSNEKLEDEMEKKRVFWWHYDQDQQRWGYEFVSLEKMLRKITFYHYSNRWLLNQVIKLKTNKKQYEMIRFYLPEIVEEDQFYYPVVFMLLDLEKKQVAWQYSDIMSDEGFNERILDDLCRFFLDQQRKPAKILTADHVIMNLINDFCHHAKIETMLLMQTIGGNAVIKDFFSDEETTDDLLSEILLELTSAGLEEVDKEELEAILEEMLGFSVEDALEMDTEEFEAGLEARLGVSVEEALEMDDKEFEAILEKTLGISVGDTKANKGKDSKVIDISTRKPVGKKRKK